MATIRKLKSSSPSSFTYEWAYDVFLSFRGEDTRMGFTGNLYNALCEKGINTFIDDQELRKGEEITPALMMAIQQSRIAIVVFSENYASSTFCLEELTKIMECMKHKGRLIWPVFYKVDPSDVRHLKGCYAKALANCERKTLDKEKVKKWRLALKAAANLLGWHFKNGYEYEFIGKIIEEVSKKINRKPLHVAKYPIGLEPRVKKVNSFLKDESDDRVHMVGIYGMGGLGKTTLAREVYNSIAHDSIGFLKKLEDLNLNCCTSLRIFPSGINLPSLQTLSVRNCPSLKKFPEILGKMEKVAYLCLSDSGINELPFSVGNLTIDRCNELAEVPSSIFMLPKLVTVEAYICKQLSQIKKGKSQIISSDLRKGY